LGRGRRQVPEAPNKAGKTTQMRRPHKASRADTQDTAAPGR